MPSKIVAAPAGIGAALQRAGRRLRRVARPVALPRGHHHPPHGIAPLTPEQQAAVDAFFRVYYEQRISGRETVRLNWLGYRIYKCPFDLWSYQEIVVETRPDLVVECGTRFGGGALFLATIMDLLGAGEVVTIDTAAAERPPHPRIRYLTGSTIDPLIFDQVRRASQGRRTMVILDSDHRAEHVAAELRLYPELVTPGCYLIVDDTSIDGDPGWEGFGAGPMAALEGFLATTDDFEVDRDRERFMLTLNPRGFLRRRELPRRPA